MFVCVCECGVSVCECLFVSVRESLRAFVCLSCAHCTASGQVCCTSARVKVDLANSNNPSILGIIAAYI